MLARQPLQATAHVPKRERGFALLLVFAMAASVAILIYLEIPRVAFERQRDKEALLIDRGEQYSRAIELYARKMNKNPQTLDDLEKAQTVRFLRRRYKDPMTGKDEWRLVHVNANGQYVDSKVHKAAGALDKQDSGPSILASKFQGVGASASVISPDGQGVSAALQKRASDRITPGGTPGASPPDAGQNGAADPNSTGNTDPSQPQTNSDQAGQAAGGAPAGSNGPKFPFPSQAGANAQQPGTAQDGNTPALSSVLPADQQDAGAAASNQTGSAQPQAIQAIQSILGSQQQRTSTSNSSGGGAQAGGVPSGLGAGLVGVATTLEGEGIRRYKDHSNYSEWEFIYDPKDSKGQAQGSGTQKSTTGSTTGASSFGGMSGGPAAPSGSTPNN